MFFCYSPWSSREVRVSLVAIDECEALNICPTSASDFACVVLSLACVERILTERRSGK